MLDISSYTVRVKELNPTIFIREALFDDGSKFVALFNKYYKRKTNLEYYKWQFFDSPYVSKLFVAFDHEELIGYYGIKKYPLSGAKKMNTGFAIDFLIDVSYRKRGIGYLLEAEIVNFSQKSDISVLTSLPNAYGNAAFKALGWKSIAKIDSLVNEEINITAQNEMVVKNKCKVAFLKNDEYRIWRFDQNPIYQYKKITVDKDTFAITKLFNDPDSGIVYGDIVNIAFKQNSVETGKLFDLIMQDMKKLGVKVIATWALPHTELYSLLLNSGYKILEQQRFFCIKLIDERLDQLYDINNWNLEQSDAEIY